LWLRSSLREFFPAALEAYEDLASPDALELLTKTPVPNSAARLTRAQITAALKRARRRDRDAKATAIIVALRRAPHPAAAYRGRVRYDGARARKNYAGTSPITRASGKKKVVLAR